MQIKVVNPHGCCLGVIRAIRIAAKTAAENPGKTITMLGMVVHNQHVVDTLKNAGIQYVEDRKLSRLELLDQVPDGIVIFTAHGVSDDVVHKAESRGLEIVDATCPDVLKTHNLVKEHTRNGDVIYIGLSNHPESEGTVGLSKRVHLITSIADLDRLGHLENVLITNQTTLSYLDCQDLISACLEKYPGAQVAKEICNATMLRQQAVMKLHNTDTLFVVGDPASNNTRQLCLLGKHAGINNIYLLRDISDLKPEMLDQAADVAITSGSSTPNAYTEQIIAYLKEYAETGEFRPLPPVVQLSLPF